MAYIFDTNQLKYIETCIKNNKNIKWIGKQLGCSDKTIKRTIIKNKISSILTNSEKITFFKYYIENGTIKEIPFIHYKNEKNIIYKESCFEYGLWWHRQPESKNTNRYFRTCINYERLFLHRYKYEIEHKCSIISGEVDHINDDKSDNSIHNLQLLSSYDHGVKTSTGRIQSPEKLSKLSKLHKGIPKSDEHKKKLSESAKNRWNKK